MIPAEEVGRADGLYATKYDRSKCQIGFVHLGYGAFHRAHQAVYIDDYLEQTGDLRWGIAAVNLRASESEAFEAAQQADGGYLLKTTSPDGQRELRLVRAHCQFLDWSKQKTKSEEILTSPCVHSVTITVTESGYYLKDDWTLNLDHPAIAAELAGGEGTSVYAYLASALKLRMERIGSPLNILCCDNIRSNGKILESNLLAYLEQIGADELLSWVKHSCSFPCSMVDRIVPASTPRQRERQSELLGVLDEVDAPLDDANVDRFCLLLDEIAHAGSTRFLCVTHHRMTMARMDRLFGVTMGERGVSQLVSVDLRQAEELRDSA